MVNGGSSYLDSPFWTTHPLSSMWTIFATSKKRTVPSRWCTLFWCQWQAEQIPVHSTRQYIETQLKKEKPLLGAYKTKDKAFFLYWLEKNNNNNNSNTWELVHFAWLFIFSPDRDYGKSIVPVAGRYQLRPPSLTIRQIRVRRDELCRGTKWRTNWIKRN